MTRTVTHSSRHSCLDVSESRLVLAFAFRLGVDSDGPLEEAQRVDLDSFVKHVVSMSNVKEQLFLKVLSGLS
jgi:hypothetical protein